ncbi:MAG: SHOCT domain-containing protein [Solirubrobacterales bacterium]|nr:SHOCT domain-containing protein [Solirubrobacterales bacterium]
MGLIGMVGRSAVIAETATAVSNRVSRRQYNRWAQQDAQYYQQPAPAPQYYQPPAAAPASAPTSTPAPDIGADDRIAKLKDLANLKAQGILIEEEFATEKARILGE